MATDTRTIAVGQVAIDAIDVPPDHKRAPGNDAELRASMEAEGLLQPIIVRQVGDNHYELVAGARRLDAAKVLGWTSIMASLREADDTDRLVARTTENVQRQQLHPLEEAGEYDRLASRGLAIADIARRVGRSGVHVSNRLALLSLPTDIQGVIGDQITLGDALELAKLSANEEAVRQAFAAIRGGVPAENAVRAQLIRLAASHQVASEAEDIKKEGLTLFAGVLGKDGFPVSRDEPQPGYLYWPADRNNDPDWQWAVDAEGSRFAVAVNPLAYLADSDEEVRQSAQALVESTKGTVEAPAQPITRDEAEKRRAAEDRKRKRELKKRDEARETHVTSLVRKGVKAGEVTDLMIQTLVENLPQTTQDTIYARCNVARVERTEGFGEQWDIAKYLEGRGSWLKIGYAAALQIMEDRLDGAVKEGTKLMHGSAAELGLLYLTHLQGTGYVISDIEAEMVGMDSTDEPSDDKSGDQEDDE